MATAAALGYTYISRRWRARSTAPSVHVADGSEGGDGLSTVPKALSPACSSLVLDTSSADATTVTIPQEYALPLRAVRTRALRTNAAVAALPDGVLGQLLELTRRSVPSWDVRYLSFHASRILSRLLLTAYPPHSP